ncbi:hypothetical protein FOA52_015051 [Chlamydomonas sp. UWO 241]|nr:hypothetical protein FOA52_015051 [Chlamydomonas sp. UWO 241]
MIAKKTRTAHESVPMAFVEDDSDWICAAPVQQHGVGSTKRGQSDTSALTLMASEHQAASAISLDTSDDEPDPSAAAARALRQGSIATPWLPPVLPSSLALPQQQQQQQQQPSGTAGVVSGQKVGRAGMHGQPEATKLFRGVAANMPESSAWQAAAPSAQQPSTTHRAGSDESAPGSSDGGQAHTQRALKRRAADVADAADVNAPVNKGRSQSQGLVDVCVPQADADRMFRDSGLQLEVQLRCRLDGVRLQSATATKVTVFSRPDSGSGATTLFSLDSGPLLDLIESDASRAWSFVGGRGHSSLPTLILDLAGDFLDTGHSEQLTAKTKSAFHGLSSDKNNWKARLWDSSMQCKVYLGTYDTEAAAARANDRASIVFHGAEAKTNFPLTDYDQELPQLWKMTREDVVAHVLRNSSGFSQGVSKYRGVGKDDRSGRRRWHVRVKSGSGRPHAHTHTRKAARALSNPEAFETLMAGVFNVRTYDADEVAARVYDFAVLSLRGIDTQNVTNFDKGTYLDADGALLTVEAALPGLGRDKLKFVRKKLAAVPKAQVQQQLAQDLQPQQTRLLPPSAQAEGPPRDYRARSAALAYLRDLKLALDEGALPLDAYQKEYGQIDPCLPPAAMVGSTTLAQLSSLASAASSSSSQQGIPEKDAAHAALRGALQTSGADLFKAVAEAMGDASTRDLLRACLYVSRPADPLAPQPTDDVHARLVKLMLGFTTNTAEPPPHAHDYPKLLLEEMPFMATAQLERVLRSVVTSLEGGLPGLPLLLGLLPASLSAMLRVMPPKPAGEGDDVVAATQPKDPRAARDEAVQRICVSEWPAEHVASVVGALREVPMTPEQLVLVLTAACKYAVACELQALPSVTYQLLLLSHAAQRALAAGGGRARQPQVLAGVVGLMDALVSQQRHQAGQGATGPGAVLRQVSGVVLMHIAQASRYDHALVTTWLEHLDAAHAASLAAAVGAAAGGAPAPVGARTQRQRAQPGPFQLSLLCALCAPEGIGGGAGAAAGSTQARSLSALRRMVDDAFVSDDARAPESTGSPQQQPPAAAAALAGDVLTQSLLGVVRGSAGGSELVAQGLLELSLSLLSSLAPGGGIGSVHTDVTRELQELAELSAAEVAAQLGAASDARRRARAVAAAAGGGAGGAAGGSSGGAGGSHAGAAAGAGGLLTVTPASSGCGRVRGCLLGVRLVASLFSDHPDARPELLSRMRRCVGSPRAGAALPGALALALLSRTQARAMGEHAGALKEVLECLPSLPCEAAQHATLLALWPLCRARKDMQDMAVMLLRKVMFQRELGARLLAVRGFLHIIQWQLFGSLCATCKKARCFQARVSQAC